MSVRACHHWWLLCEFSSHCGWHNRQSSGPQLYETTNWVGATKWSSDQHSSMVASPGSCLQNLICVPDLISLKNGSWPGSVWWNTTPTPTKLLFVDDLSQSQKTNHGRQVAENMKVIKLIREKYKKGSTQGIESQETLTNTSLLQRMEMGDCHHHPKKSMMTLKKLKCLRYSSEITWRARKCAVLINVQIE